ncbi:MAG: hypothetical protein WCF33_14375 [Pseudonocardiaceae bacterium]
MVNDEALWLFTVDKPTSAPVELRRWLIRLERVWGEQKRFFAIVWDTPHGHVLPPSFVAEWPASLDAVAAWNDRTVLAADHAHQATAILALTPTDDGQMRVDPVPLRGHRAHGNAFAYGYGGGTPVTTYTAILRCALPDKYQPVSRLLHWAPGDDGERPMSQLWDAIATTKGTLRLRWSQVQHWACNDLAAVKVTAARLPQNEAMNIPKPASPAIA